MSVSVIWIIVSFFKITCMTILILFHLLLKMYSIAHMKVITHIWCYDKGDS